MLRKVFFKSGASQPQGLERQSRQSMPDSRLAGINYSIYAVRAYCPISNFCKLPNSYGWDPGGGCSGHQYEGSAGPVASGLEREEVRFCK